MLAAVARRVGAPYPALLAVGGALLACLLGVGGSVVAGAALGWLTMRLTERVRHVPTSIILQFVCTFGVWLVAEAAGLSGVLTTVCYAMTLARSAPERIAARTRIPTEAVWATV